MVKGVLFLVESLFCSFCCCLDSIYVVLSRELFVVEILISLNFWKGCGLWTLVILVDMLCCCDDSTCELLCGLVVIIGSIQVAFNRCCGGIREASHCC